MIANISPSNISSGETQNTLHWADHAKLIKPKACSAANEEAVKLVLELQDEESELQIEASTAVDGETRQVPYSETDVAKLALEKENIVLAAENVELRRKVKVLEAEIEKMEEHLVQLKQKADVTEASLWKQRDAIQYTCTHILALPDDAISEILLRLPQDSPLCASSEPPLSASCGSGSSPTWASSATLGYSIQRLMFRAFSKTSSNLSLSPPPPLPSPCPLPCCVVAVAPSSSLIVVTDVPYSSSLACRWFCFSGSQRWASGGTCPCLQPSNQISVFPLQWR